MNFTFAKVVNDWKKDGPSWSDEGIKPDPVVFFAVARLALYTATSWEEPPTRIIGEAPPLKEAISPSRLSEKVFGCDVFPVND